MVISRKGAKSPREHIFEMISIATSQKTVVFLNVTVLNAEQRSSRRYAEALTIFSAILCGLRVSAMKTTRSFI